MNLSFVLLFIMLNVHLRAARDERLDLQVLRQRHVFLFFFSTNK